MFPGLQAAQAEKEFKKVYMTISQTITAQCLYIGVK